MRKAGQISRIPIRDYIAAVSAGVVDNKILLDLDYKEDSAAQVDMNFVITGSGLFVEVQGTAESHPFDRTTLDTMMELAKDGIARLIEKQKEVLGEIIDKT